MANAIFSIDPPANEPVLEYRPGSNERRRIKDELQRLRNMEMEIPLIIGGRPIKTGNLGRCTIPHDHGHQLALFHQAGEKEVSVAIEAAASAAGEWAAMDWYDRLAIFTRAADLIAGPRRMTLNAATMLGQGKNIFQAEIDSACEIIDFLRFNAFYATQIYRQQPQSGPAEWNHLEYRPLEGFVFAVTPFNFTAIAGNLPSAPAMLGNTVLWKPASSAVYSAWMLMETFIEAGLPPGVINFIPGSGARVGTPVLASPDLAGIHFTGSTSVFQGMWKTVADNLGRYRGYPRIVGETGGKDFVFVHPSADPDAVVTALIRGAFEYQGQKCSAVSRTYLPKSLWAELKEKLTAALLTIKVGTPEDFSNFVNAVIDRAAFDAITGYIEYARKHAEAEIIAGGAYDRSSGYFIEPTVILTTDPHFKTMEEEIFGPVLTVYVYADEDFEATLDLCDRTSPYALTGAIWARDRGAVATARRRLVHAAGNFYINDKPTGAVVGRQPFGGGRMSGTNDKAGSFLNLYRWVSPRTIKENFLPATDYRYPFMDAE
ncbi:MAG: L-glutamate gamma-semialdehyde dehydrogenase [Deltaproteobacteria bacterium]|nr:L-glutamate gamma-semialdehyde dehydrogenase [Deltaproteobacteria bacterium]